MSSNERAVELPQQIIIAKDLLDLLTGAMYVDPFSALREYVQNAVDAIEDAVAVGVLEAPSEGRIDIQVSQAKRAIVIRDNGIGCGNKDFVRSLTAFGGSDKRGRERRGFRGIGRLAGLAYCRELVFRGKSTGDSNVLEMVWDCVKLKELLYSDQSEMSLNEIVHSVLQVRELRGKEFPDHFFEVTLNGVVRYKNDELLDSQTLISYLSQVAPVPFSPDFTFGDEISEFIEDHIGDHSFNIYVNDSDEPLVKPYRNSFLARPDLYSHFSHVEYIRIPGIHQDVDAIGWVLHHEYLGAISPDQMIGGLRLRSGNIQIGNSDVLRTIFPQPRFNEWSCGEAHILNPKIRPNGRRDNIEFNAHVSNLYDKLRPIGSNVARKCREFSNTRSTLNRFGKACEDSEYLMSLLSDGYFRPKQALSYFEYLDGQERQLEEMADQLHAMVMDGKSVKRRLSNWRRKRTNAVRKIGNGQGELDLPKTKVSTYQRVFEIVYDEMRDKGEAASVIRRIAQKAGR